MADGDLSTMVYAELAELERDPAFVRAPVMRRLLKFLVDESLAGRGERLKSVTVAVEGLGRQADFDPQADSYPRVQVGRLRKMLDAHYSQHSNSILRLRIPTGGYRVEFEAEPSPTKHSPAETPRRGVAAARPPVVIAGLVGGLITALVGLAFVLANMREDGSRWTVRDFPVVHVDTITAEGGASASAASELRDLLIDRLSRFDTIDVTSAAGRADRYRIEGSVRPAGAGSNARISLIADDGRVVWSRSHDIAVPGPQALDTRTFVDQVTGRLAQPGGVIHSDQRARNVAADTPYGCWLEFMTLWAGRHAAKPQLVRSCVESWVAENPSASMPHALMSWLLVEQAGVVAGGDRDRLLVVAKREAVRAAELKPNSAVAQYMLMYVSIYRREFPEMRTAAKRVLALNGNNPELAALAGLHLVYLGDLSGKPILDRAIIDHFSPPHWLYTGQIYAAVLENDPAGALRAARKFQTDTPTSLQKGLLAMALARSGNVDDARRRWREAVALEPSLAADPGVLFARWPIAASIKSRSLEWLRPALG